MLKDAFNIQDSILFDKYGDLTQEAKDTLLQVVSKKLEKINKRLEELEKENKVNLSISNEELIQKAILFILEQKLNDKREINFNQLMNNIDGHIVKYLFNYIIQNFCVKYGKIISICFKNGTKHEFLYKKL